MAIEFHCSNCDRTLRVKVSQAGYDAVCPACGAKSSIPSDAREVDAPASAPSVETVDWHMRTGEGESYGPVTRTELDRWYGEGRIDDGCQILQEGWSQWKWASDVYSGREASPGVPSRRTASENAGAHLQPHRGTAVLVLGILSLVLCGLLGIPALIMGRADLRAMKEGTMDPTGQGSTQAGFICAIISVALMMLWVLFLGFYLVVAVFALGAGVR